jgi:hypothetical protein
MCLPLALFLMALPSLTGQTVHGPALRTRAHDEPLITWDNLWMLPVGYLAVVGLLTGVGFLIARWRK